MNLRLVPIGVCSIGARCSYPNKSDNRVLCSVFKNNLNILKKQQNSVRFFVAANQNTYLFDSGKLQSRKPLLEPNDAMEVEVKLRLLNSSAHQKLSDLLSPYRVKTHTQENILFDGANAELSSNLAVLRIRFYDNDSQCVLSLKAKPVISGGISRIEEHEEPLDPVIGRACVGEPERLRFIESSKIMERVREEYGIGEKGFACLGGFSNVRQVHEWKGLKLELDETIYDFGKSYEIECESNEPERAKNLLEEFLTENGIDYWYSETSKFAVFRSGKLPQL